MVTLLILQKYIHFQKYAFQRLSIPRHDKPRPMKFRPTRDFAKCAAKKIGDEKTSVAENDCGIWLMYVSKCSIGDYMAVARLVVAIWDPLYNRHSQKKNVPREEMQIRYRVRLTIESHLKV